MNPKKQMKAMPKPKPLSKEEQAQIIFRQYSQKFASYMEAAVFNLIAGGRAVDKQLYETAATVAEQLIDEVPLAVNAAFERRLERATRAAEKAEKNGGTDL